MHHTKYSGFVQPEAALFPRLTQKNFIALFHAAARLCREKGRQQQNRGQHELSI
jgi:hypothetical protein